MILIDTIKTKIAQSLEKSIKELYPEVSLTDQDIYPHIGYPPKFEMGHYTFGAFILSKACKKSPAQIANEISNHLTTDYSEEIKPLGPYINFKIKMDFIGKEVLESILDGHFFQNKLTNTPQNCMIEFASVNSHKEIHVGHMLNISMGQSLSRILKYIGHNVLNSIFPGDVGTHVAKCLWYLKKVDPSDYPQENKGEWLGKLYSTANNILEDERGTPKEEDNKKQLTEILAQIERGQGEYFDLWKETRSWSIALFKEVFSWAQVNFDHWFFESDVDSDSIKFAKKLYEEGKLVKDDGAIGMDLSDDKLGFCLLIKSDGNGLYSTKDVELARRKFELEIEKSIYIVDIRQKFHLQQVFKVLEKIGFKEAKNCLHIPHEFVELTDGPMSSRKGNIIPLTKLVENMENSIKTNYLKKYENEWSPSQIEKTAEKIARGAIYFGMLKNDSNKKIIFNMDEWLKLEGDSGPYLQYVYARIQALLTKQQYDQTKAVDWNLLTSETEKELAINLTKFNQIILTSEKESKPSILAGYIYSTAKMFNHFYATCPIGKINDENLKASRLSLSKSTAVIIEKGLFLLGIECPEKM